MTAEEIEQARTESGGWTREKLAEWGIPWPPPKNWKEFLVNRAAAPEVATEPVYEPIEVAIALALYEHNVSPVVRAETICKHFLGECPEVPELLECMTYGHAVTALPFPSAEVYLRAALRRYGEEARRRVHKERGAI